jgi:hypothetical protein
LVSLRIDRGESSNELSGSIKWWETAEGLHNLWPVEWYSAPQSQLFRHGKFNLIEFDIYITVARRLLAKKSELNPSTPELLGFWTFAIVWNSRY